MLTEFDRGWEFQDEERREAEEPSSTEMGPPDEASENVDEASWDDEGGESGEDSRLGDEPSWREQVPTAPPTVAQAEGPNGTRAATGQFSGAGVTRGKLGWDGLRKGRRLVKPDETRLPLSPHERLLILDTWQRSGLPAGDFAPLVGLSKHTLYLWKKRFAQQGPAGLMEHRRGASPGSKLSEVTKRTIVMLKQLHPDWGCQRISDELLRGPALAAGAAAVARVLHEAGYQMEQRATRPHRDKTRRFERARPNQLWQTDLFTFILKRQSFWKPRCRGIISGRSGL